MAYNAVIPQATDRPSNSQPQILANFTSIDTVNSVNHVAFDDPSGKQGMHKWVSLPTQGAPAGSFPTTAATDIAIFSQTSDYTAVTELAIRKQNNGSVFEFTGAQNGTNGWTVLPSGILMKWHLEAQNWSGNRTLTYTWPVAATIPTFSAVHNIQTTIFQSGTSDLNANIRVQSSSTTQVVMRLYNPTATNVGFYIFALGLANPVT